jgi:hypothetical protein
VADDADRLKTINESGFPLQIAVCHLVASANKPSWPWQIRYTEHAWRHDEAKAEGFIDVVLQNTADRVCLVIECKRVRDADWLFLVDWDHARPHRQTKLWLNWYADGKHKRRGWA